MTEPPNIHIDLTTNVGVPTNPLWELRRTENGWEERFDHGEWQPLRPEVTEPKDHT